ncbi:sporulation peptidase YabG [Calderihabitans maritimus]|uniref:Coenzyme F420-reducing hydrogenase, alpha subunit n=1 Tax=Calderihabitans maritimus TaxID=1246530 RepID=A0A1Z5HQ21_9FIRM|nr:sporulation peptidase YabG [Calderihabitans maritimus]GAW91629.1 coenzyme F420-reducing hydrogenase, alpha subunit [Calderihabitans maritimus]
MAKIKPGDIVARKSYGGDIYFRVQNVRVGTNGEKICVLRGLDVRLIADAPEDDLEVKNKREIQHHRRQIIKEGRDMLERILQRQSQNKKKEAFPIYMLEVPGRKK